MSSSFQYSPPVLPFDIIAQIIDIVGDKKDTNLLKELALVSYTFHQLCIKHLFATVELHDAVPNYHASSIFVYDSTCKIDSESEANRPPVT